MSEGIRRCGVVGLGRMRGGLALQAIEKGYRVVEYTHNRVSDDLRRAGAMMRHGFGGHPYGRAESIAEGRRTERVGDFVGGDAFK